MLRFEIEREMLNGTLAVNEIPEAWNAKMRDYLGITSNRRVHWRFVEDAQVPYGPWKKYGQPANVTAANNPDLAAQQRYFEYLRKVRDEQFMRKTKSQLENGQ